MQMLQQRSARSQLPMSMWQEDNLELLLNNHPQTKTNTYHHTISISDKKLCVKTLLLGDGSLQQFKALCPEPRS